MDISIQCSSVSGSHRLTHLHPSGRIKHHPFTCSIRVVYVECDHRLVPTGEHGVMLPRFSHVVWHFDPREKLMCRSEHPPAHSSLAFISLLSVAVRVRGGFAVRMAKRNKDNNACNSRILRTETKLSSVVATVVVDVLVVIIINALCHHPSPVVFVYMSYVASWHQWQRRGADGSPSAPARCDSKI